MKYVICLKKKHWQSMARAFRKQWVIRWGFILYPHSSLNIFSPQEPMGQQCPWVPESVQGATFQGLVCAWALDLPWQPALYRVPWGAQNLDEVVQAPTEGTLAPSVWQTQDPSSLQCYRMGRWAFKDMSPLLPFLPITHREGKRCGRGCI